MADSNSVHDYIMPVIIEAFETLPHQFFVGEGDMSGVWGHALLTFNQFVVMLSATINKMDPEANDRRYVFMAYDALAIAAMHGKDEAVDHLKSLV